MNPNTMTLDEVRDELARMDGWRQALRHRHASGVEQWCWERDGGDESFDHPHPATLDGAAAAFPKDWTWTRDPSWYGWPPGIRSHWNAVSVPDTGDEVLDRYRLALACRLAEVKQ